LRQRIPWRSHEDPERPARGGRRHVGAVDLSAQATQTVNFTNLTRNGTAVTSPVFIASGDVVKFDATLTASGASNPPGTTGLGLCLEYKQSAVNDPTIANILPTDAFPIGSPTPRSDCVAGGATTTLGADFMVIQPWAHISGPGAWPSVALPVKLYDAQFTLPSTLAGSTQIALGASSVASGETFTSNGPLVRRRSPRSAEMPAVFRSR
jgi:hypothetical protein